MLDFYGQTVFYSTDFKLEFINTDNFRNPQKCGEIVRHTDGAFVMTCVYCNNMEFDDYFSLIDHINTHFNLIEAPQANFNESADIPSFSGTETTADDNSIVDEVSDECLHHHEDNFGSTIPESPVVTKSAAPHTITKNGMIRKIRRVPELICDYCSMVFHQKKQLREHMLLVHGYGVGCTYCGRQFKSNHHMINHTRSIHNKERPYACQHCKKSFSTASSLISHTRYHLNERPFLCSTCGRRFILKNQLNVHLLRVHVPKNDPRHRRFACHLCSYKTGFQFKLEEHLKTHSDARNFSCIHCERLFKSTKSLRQHMYLHSAEKRYKCKYCGLMFAQSAGKRSHERRHEKVDIKLDEFQEQYLDIEKVF